MSTLSDCDLPIAAIVLQLAAGGGWDANADMNRGSHITSFDTLMTMQVATGAIDL